MMLRRSPGVGDSPVNALPRERWLGAALLAGALYLFVGRAFAAPADHVQAWRWAAWLVCGVIYIAHIAYEHFKLHNSPRAASVHVAVGVAIGGFGLAVAGMLHSLSTTSTIRPNWFVALIAFPAVTAIPGFLGALVATAALARLSPSAEAGRR